MISTDTATTTAWASCGGGPATAQTVAATAAITKTAGTNIADTLSTSRCTGARERCACDTK